MPRLRVWIDYQPQIYADIFREVFQSYGLFDVIASTPAESDSERAALEGEDIDLVVLSLDNLGQPELAWTPERLQNSKMIAFSPSGDYGLIRSPGKTCWQEVRPFGMKQLIGLLSSERLETADS